MLNLAVYFKYLAVMALVTYLLRALPFVLVKKKITNTTAFKGFTVSIIMVPIIVPTKAPTMGINAVTPTSAPIIGA